MKKESQEAHFTYLMPTNVEPVKEFSINVFAFTATLLGVNMVLPDIPPAQIDTLLPAFLYQEWHQFFIYIISFLNISNYWIAHYMIFENIRYTDKILIRLNTLLLLSVTFLPYPTQLMSQYGRHPTVALLYGVSISFTYLMLTAITWYAYANNRLTKPELHLPIRRIIMARELVPLLLAITGAGLSYQFPRLSFLIYFLVTLLFVIPIQVFMKGVEIITPIERDRQ